MSYQISAGQMSGGLMSWTHSISHAIITLTVRISKALETGKIVGGIFIDLTDVIPHTTLLALSERIL